MKTGIQLLRNATVVVKIDGLQLLVDPMFSAKEELDPIPWSDERRNPLVNLPISSDVLQKIVHATDVVLVTHLHPDHWDALKSQGFLHLVSTEQYQFKNLLIKRVPAQHGHGALLEKLSPASGFILQTAEQTIYITGDTVWGKTLEQNLQRFQPDVIIANCGAAQFNFGEPVTLNKEDVLQMLAVCKPNAAVVLVHMEAVNHCHLTRRELMDFLTQQQFTQKVLIPTDGLFLEF
jgi:L-ascorbate metabolism protein UlaG (beta-lactamase superfamily)